MSDRNKLEEVIKTLQLKDNSDHAVAGSVLAKYIDVLARCNQQLLDIQKIRHANRPKEKDNFSAITDKVGVDLDSKIQH